MAKQPANPNTPYGRRRLRKEYEERRANMSVEDRRNLDNDSTLFYVVIVVVIGGIIFLVSGSDGLLKWFSS